MNSRLALSTAACVLLAITCTVHAIESPCNPRVLIANHNPETNSGTLASICAAEPWDVQPALASLDGSDYTLRVFGDTAYVVHFDTGRIAAFDVTSAALLAQYELGATSEPHDIAVIDGEIAYVTRHNATHLLRLDLATGDTAEIADLSIFADSGPGIVSDGNAPGMSMMARDGDHLLIQLQHVDALAMFDITTETLVDIDPETAGVQPIELQGPLPRYKMQIDQSQRRLYVSATGGMWSTSGGIEVIDLDTLESIGFALDNPDAYDVGVFLMTAADRGYFIFHTDFAPSSHLASFDSTGPMLGEIVVTLGWPQTHSLVFEPITGHLFFYHGGSQVPNPPEGGMYVLDAETGDLLTESPIDVGGWPNDIALVQQCPWDLNADHAVDVLDLLLLIGAWGEADSFAPADFNEDGFIDVLDLLELIERWGDCP